jgi:hypothetical protein
LLRFDAGFYRREKLLRLLRSPKLDQNVRDNRRDKFKAEACGNPNPSGLLITSSLAALGSP